MLRLAAASGVVPVVLLLASPGRAESTFCKDDADCPEGELCDSLYKQLIRDEEHPCHGYLTWSCVASDSKADWSGCADDADCEDGFVCEEHSKWIGYFDCRPTFCEADSDCGAFRCHTAAALCEEGPARFSGPIGPSEPEPAVPEPAPEDVEPAPAEPEPDALCALPKDPADEAPPCGLDEAVQICAPAWVPPCESDDPCGPGMTCRPVEGCVEVLHEWYPREENAALVESLCAAKWCQPSLPVSCGVDADCEDGLSCEPTEDCWDDEEEDYDCTNNNAGMCWNESWTDDWPGSLAGLFAIAISFEATGDPWSGSRSAGGPLPDFSGGVDATPDLGGEAPEPGSGDGDGDSDSGCAGAPLSLLGWLPVLLVAALRRRRPRVRW